MLKIISLSSSICYTTNCVAILWCILCNPSEFLNTGVAVFDVSNYKGYATILIILSIALFLCDWALIYNACRQTVWFIQVHTKLWQFICFAKMLSLATYSAIFGHIYVTLNTSLSFAFGNICLFNVLFHLFFLSTVSIDLAKSNQSVEAERRCYQSEETSFPGLHIELQNAFEELKKENPPPSYEDIQLQEKLPSFEEAANFEKKRHLDDLIIHEVRTTIFTQRYMQLTICDESIQSEKTTL